MSSLSQVIFYSLIGGVFSLIGGFLLIANKNRAKNLAEYATPFAAGALLSAAFIDLLPEAAHSGDIDKALMFALVGILGFFLLERLLRWFHHHHEHDDQASDPTASLIIVGDILHNFIDGIAIAAGFLVSPSTGIVVTLAVAAHEIPQEIGDFGLLLKKGLSRKKVIWVNVLSALATTIAAVTFFQLGQSAEVSLDIVLGLVAGFFIYIAVSDIIPTIHETEKKGVIGWHSGLLIIGAILVSVVTINLHGYIDQGHDHDSDDTHSSRSDDTDHDEHAEHEEDHSNEEEHSDIVKDEDHSDEHEDPEESGAHNEDHHSDEDSDK